MPVFEAKNDVRDPAGEAMFARVLFPNAPAREAALARGRRMAEGDNPFAVRATANPDFPATVSCGVKPGSIGGSLTTSAA